MIMSKKHYKQRERLVVRWETGTLPETRSLDMIAFFAIIESAGVKDGNN